MPALDLSTGARFAAVALLLPTLSTDVGAQSRTAYHLVRVAVSTPAEMARLQALDLDLAVCAGHLSSPPHVDVVAADGGLKLLIDSGLRFRVRIRDLEAHYARELAQSGPFPDDLTPPLGHGSMGGHYTLAQMEAILDTFAVDHPGICSQKVSIGQSVEGRDIWMVKISDNVGADESEPEVLYNALHHAREPVSMEATLLFMEELLTGYGEDPEATFIVDQRELYFVPCVNPDGYEYNLEKNPGGGGLWRKNRRDNRDGTFGVDLNRNYPVGWSAPNGGNSTWTGSSVYRGPAPLSEPEVAAIAELSSLHDFVQVVNTHTYTDVLLRPWFHRRAEPANAIAYDMLGDIITAASGISHGGGSDLLYVAAGTATDYQHGTHGSFAWTPELGRGNEGGFWPNPVNTVVIARRHQPMYRAVALTAGSYLDIARVAITELPGGNGNGTVEPGETGQVVVRVRNRGLSAPPSIDVEMKAQSEGVVIGTGYASVPPPRFGASHDGGPLTFFVPGAFSSGAIRLEVTVSGGGQSLVYPIRIAPRI